MSLGNPNLTPEEAEFFKLLIIRATSEDIGQPYLSYAYHSMTPVSAPGLETMGVDEKWRVYIDFEYMMEKGVIYASGVLNHEPWHLLRRHAERFKALGMRGDGKPNNAKAWNIAGDLTINGDIPNLVPEDGCFPEVGVFKEYKLDTSAEDYYAQLMADEQFNPPTCDECGQPQDKSDKDKGDKDKSDKSGDDAGDQPGDEKGDGSQPGDGDGDDADGQGKGNQPGDGNGEGESNQPGDGQGKGESNQHGNGNGTCSTCGKEKGNGQGQGQGQGQGNGQGNGQGGIPDPNCGSGAGNALGDYELGAEHDGVGLEEDEVDGVIKATAESVKQYGEQHGIGKLPGGARLWAEQELQAPPLDWRTILRGLIKNAVAWKKGQLDINRSRRNRRQPNPDIITPAWAAPKPRLAVAFDTSGSNLHNLGVVVDEIENIVKSVGIRGNDLLAFGVDVRASEVKPVNNPRTVLDEMVGGGGTDMSVGFEQLANLGRRGKADIGVLITDLMTPWPKEKPAGKMKYVLIGIVNGTGYEESFIKSAEEAIGDWANIIIIDTSEEV